MVEFLLEPLQFTFIQRALFMGVLIGVLCPVVGSYLVVQRLALLGDVIAHCVLPGVALSLFFQIDKLWGALIVGLMSTGVIHWVQSAPESRWTGQWRLRLLVFLPWAFY